MRRGSERLLIPVLIFLLAGAAWGERNIIPVSGHDPGIELLRQTDGALTFRITVGELQAFDVETKEGTFSRLTLPGFHASLDQGEPELPMINRLFEIPYGAECSVEVNRYDTHEIVLADHGIEHRLMPAQPSVFKNQDPATLPFHFNSNTYSRDEEYGREPARALDTGRMRSVRIGRLEISPVRYNPQRGTITVRENIEVTVTFNGADHAAGDALKARTYSPFFETVYGKLEAYRSPHTDHPDLLDGPVTYVIVADPMFESQLQPFIQWKTEQGFRVVEGYVGDPDVGSTSSSIRTYLHDLYNNGTPELPSPTFVLFVGDVAEVPAWSLSGYSDLPYCDLTGDDVPEMYYGRFSASNAGALQPQIDKTLEYEQYLMPTPSFLGEVVMTAGYDATYGATYGNGQINYGTNHYFNRDFNIVSHTYLYPESGSSDEEIIADVSDGVSYINYTAHGSQTSWGNPAFTMTDVSNLTNNHEYCLAVGNCCLTSSFQVTTCFAEQWLRVADRGGIGYIGAANNTMWDEDYWWGVGYGPVVAGGATYEQTGLGVYDGMFHSHGEETGQWFVCQDAHVFCGNLGVQESGSGSTDYYWEIYNLMGDPSLCVYFGLPTANGVTLPENILPTATEVEITADPKSYIGLTKDGVLLGSGMTDQYGNATISIAGQGYDGAVDVVVTAQNRIPYTASVPIMVLEGPQLVIDHNDLIDTGGDNDGALDAGESVELITWLRNIGTEAATDVTGILSISRGVVITDDSESWGAIAVDQTKDCDDSFNLTASPDTPDQTVVEFTLAIASAETTWTRGFSLTVEAPVLGLLSMTIDDGAGGDGDGLAEPGETVELTFHLENTGHEDARNVTGLLSCSSQFAVVNVNSAFVSSVPEAGTEDLAGYSVSIAHACPEMSTLHLDLDVTGDLGYAVSFTGVALPVAPFFDDFESDMGWTVSGAATAGAWERADPEGTTYNSQPLQTEDDHTPAPGVQCMVTGPLAGSSAGSYDVDGGATILTSPLFDLTGALSATVEYWRWYTNNLGNAPGEDWWTVEATDNDGGDWVYLEHTQESDNSWTKFSFDLDGLIDMTDQVRFRFTAEDVGSGSLVEAAVDDFLLYAEKEDVSTGVETAETTVPRRFELMQNSPNPFNPLTVIRYTLEGTAPARTTLRVYDTAGRLVRTLVDEPQAAGAQSATWNGEDSRGRAVTSGVFFYVLTSGDEKTSRKMVLIR